MDLKININNSNRCDVRFQSHHKFAKVLGLLRNNKILPENVKDQQVKIQDSKGNLYSMGDMVKECVGENNKGSINIFFQVDNNQASKVLESGARSRAISSAENREEKGSSISALQWKEKMLEVVRTFLDRIQKRKFKDIERYWDHSQPVLKEVARFSKVYQNLYILLIFWKSGLCTFTQTQKRQFLEYKQKYGGQFAKIEKEKQEKIKRESRQIRDVRQEYQGQIKMWQQKFEAERRQKMKIQRKYLKNEDEFTKRQRQNQVKISQLQDQLQEEKTKNFQLSRQIKSLNKTIEEQIQKIDDFTDRIKDLELELTQQTSLKERFQEELEQFKQKCQEKQTQLKEQINFLKEKRQELEADIDLFNSIKPQSNPSSLQQKIKKKQSAQELHPFDQHSLSKIMNCQITTLQQIFKNINKKDGQPQLEVVFEWNKKNTQRNNSKNINRSVFANKNVLFVGQTTLNNIVGGYSTIDFNLQGQKSSFKKQNNKKTSFLFNFDTIAGLSIFPLKNQKHQPLAYDPQFLVFGDEDLTVDYSNSSLSSRFTLSTLDYSSFAFQDIYPQLQIVDQNSKQKRIQKRRERFLGDLDVNQVELQWYYLITCKQ